MLVLHVLNMTQPVVAQAQPIASKRRLYAAATIVSTHDDMADFENFDGKLHDREAVEVRMHDQIGDIPMDQQFTGQQPDDFIGRHPAVRASDPQIGRRLLAGELQEKFRVLLLNALGPFPVVGEKMVEFLHWLNGGNLTPEMSHDQTAMSILSYAQNCRWHRLHAGQGCFCNVRKSTSAGRR